MLSDATIAALWAKKEPKPKGASQTRSGTLCLGKVIVRENGSLVCKKFYRMSEVTLGKFEGKVGTTHRSRKGRTVRHANGRRFYSPLQNEVVAYSLTKR